MNALAGVAGIALVLVNAFLVLGCSDESTSMDLGANDKLDEPEEIRTATFTWHMTDPDALPGICGSNAGCAFYDKNGNFLIYSPKPPVKEFTRDIVTMDDARWRAFAHESFHAFGYGHAK